MDAITVSVSLSYDSPITPAQIQQLHDKFYELLDSEVNDGQLALEDAEVTDFEVELQRTEE